jgi:hypothetical protein
LVRADLDDKNPHQAFLAPPLLTKLTPGADGTTSCLKYLRTPQAEHPASPAETLGKVGALYYKQYQNHFLIKAKIVFE